MDTSTAAKNQSGRWGPWTASSTLSQTVALTAAATMARRSSVSAAMAIPTIRIPTVQEAVASGTPFTDAAAPWVNVAMGTIPTRKRLIRRATCRRSSSTRRR